MYACMYVCMHVCMYVCTVYVCMRVFVCMCGVGGLLLCDLGSVPGGYNTEEMKCESSASLNYGRNYNNTANTHSNTNTHTHITKNAHEYTITGQYCVVFLTIFNLL